MSIRPLTLLLSAGVLVVVSWSARAADADANLADEVLLKSVGLATDGPALVDFFRQRSKAQAPREKLTELIKQLGDKEPATRAKAAGTLVAIGPAAIPLLRQAVKDPDEGDAVALARRCLTAIEGETSGTIPAAAARLLAQRQPAGAVDVLLAYLPFADNDTVIEDVKAALAGMAYRDGKPNASLLKALEDESSLRRAVAIDALCAAGPAEPRDKLIKLLEDKKPIVRMRAGLALANVREEKAVATLIKLLAELPHAYGIQVEEHLVGLAGEQAPKEKLTNAPGAKDKCHDAWETWWKTSADPEKLVGEFRKRTLKDIERAKVVSLIKQLGNDDFDIREKAHADLEAMGPAVLPLLKKSKDDPDVEIRDRSKKLIVSIEKDKGAPLSPVTARLIALRKPKEAADAILAFIPFAEEMNQDEVQAALNIVAYRDGKPDPIVLKGLEDKSPVRRVAAAVALCRPGTAYPQAAVRKLLKDSEASVRMKAALALAAVHDKEAMPVLIASLADLPGDESHPAEELLHRLAAGRGPADVTGSDDEARKKRRDAWNAWWKDNGAKVDLAMLDKAPAHERYLGYTVIAMNGNRRVCEIGLDGKERWHIDNLNNPWDAHWLPGDKVLIAEFQPGEVTERNMKGEVLWKKQCQNPIACQRLRNGNTFIVTRQQMLEVTPSGKDVMTINRNWDIMGAKKLKNGQIVMFTNQGSAIFFDAKGKETKSIHVGNGGVQWGGGDVTEEGHVIVPQWQFNKVVEYNRDGKEVWSASFQWPNACQRLPDGTTLVASQNTNKIAVFDKTGKKVVWEHQLNGQPFRIHRR